jgi:hypothetical protein
MKRVVGCTALAVALCGLIPGAAGEGQQKRPYFLWGDWRFAVNIDPSSPEFGQVVEHGTGVATLRGRVTVDGGGLMNMVTGVYTGSGVATDASGDETWWWIEDVFGPTAVVHIDGGTGRFEGATGELTNFEITNQQDEVQWPYLITTCELKVTGWIIY